MSSAERLRAELSEAGVRVERIMPAWCATPERQAWFFDWLLTAITPELHEGRLAPMSLLLIETHEDLVDGGIATLSSSLALLAAEGRARAAALTPAGEWLTIENRSGRDPHRFLADLTTVHDGVGLLRDPDGVVYVFTHTATLRHHMRSWTLRPGTIEAAERIHRSVPQVDTKVLDEVLELATQTLSPRGIGATLILPVAPFAPVAERVANLQDVADLRLTLADGETIAHLLAHVDGATLLTQDGRVSAIGAHLLASDRAIALIPARRGTRHTSAIRFSYDVSEVVVVTVSADGPVSVFSDGISLFETGWWSAAHQAQRLEQALSPLGQEANWTSEGATVRCENCGKSSLVEKLTVAGWHGSETARCPVCAHAVAEGHYFEIRANIIKSL